jgi:hypothetical protein
MNLARTDHGIRLRMMMMMMMMMILIGNLSSKHHKKSSTDRHDRRMPLVKLSPQPIETKRAHSTTTTRQHYNIVKTKQARNRTHLCNGQPSHGANITCQKKKKTAQKWTDNLRRKRPHVCRETQRRVPIRDQHVNVDRRCVRGCFVRVLRFRSQIWIKVAGKSEHHNCPYSSLCARLLYRHSDRSRSTSHSRPTANMSSREIRFSKSNAKIPKSSTQV